MLTKYDSRDKQSLITSVMFQTNFYSKAF